MKKLMRNTLLLSAVMLCTSGCTTGMAMMAMNGFGACSPADFRHNEFRNTRLHTVSAGTDKDVLVQQFGTPEKEKSFKTRAGKIFRVMFFNTGAAHCRSYTPDSVPIITYQGTVYGAGEETYQRLLKS